MEEDFNNKIREYKEELSGILNKHKSFSLEISSHYEDLYQKRVREINEVMSQKVIIRNLEKKNQDLKEMNVWIEKLNKIRLIKKRLAVYRAKFLEHQIKEANSLIFEFTNPLTKDEISKVAKETKFEPSTSSLEYNFLAIETLLEENFLRQVVSSFIFQIKFL